MATGECEKIIEQVTDPRNLNDQCRQHIKVCRECAAVVACLVWTRTKGSPTADLKPSQAFLNRIDQSLTSSPGGGVGTGLSGGNTLLAWVLGAALTASIAISLIISINKEPALSGSSNGITASEASKNSHSAAQSESRILNKQQTAPVLKFSSPSDDAD